MERSPAFDARVAATSSPARDAEGRSRARHSIVGVLGTRDPSLTLHAWRGGEQAPEKVTLAAVGDRVREKVPVWVDVTLVDDPLHVGHRLEGVLPGFKAKMLPALINPPSSAAEDAVRLIQVARFEAPTVYPGGSGPQLLVAPLNILCGDGWVLTFRGPAGEAAGGVTSARIEVEGLVLAVRPAWDRTDLTADDLATLWLVALTRTAKESATNLGRYLLNADLARWEEIGNRPTEVELRALAFRIDALSLSLRRLERPGVPPEEAWFRPRVCRGAAIETSQTIATVLTYLDSVRRDLRMSLEQVRADSSAAAASADEAERHKIELLVAGAASLFLWPSLVATVFGAFPTWFEHAPTSRLVALITTSVAMLAVVALGLFFVMTARGRQVRGKGWRMFAAALAAALIATLVIANLGTGSSPRDVAMQALRSRLSSAQARLDQQQTQVKQISDDQIALRARIADLQRRLRAAQRSPSGD